METLIEWVEIISLVLAVTALALILVGVLIEVITSWIRSTRKTRTVQEIFDAVINSGCYSETRRFMCPALGAARAHGVITLEEYRLAIKEVKTYLDGIPCLILALGDSRTPVSFNTTKAVYKNWADRPVIYQHSKNTIRILTTARYSQENLYAEKPTI